LPETVTLGTGGATVVAYPALVDEGEHVALRYLASEAEQDFHNRRGLVRLAALKLPQLARQLHKDLSRDRELGLLFAPLGSSEQLHVELLGGAIWACFFENRPLPRDPGTFSERLQAHRGDLSGRFAGMQSTLREVLGLRLKLVRELDLATSPAYAETVEDIRAQVDALIPATVMTDTPAAYQPELPRYLEAARYRLAHLQGRVPRDLANTRVIRGFSERLERLARDHAAATAERLKLRFGLEEVRVGLFAEPLGVRGKASAKRLDRELELLEWEQGLI
jgi:ATP-dependent helicase HrpA